VPELTAIRLVAVAPRSLDISLRADDDDCQARKTGRLRLLARIHLSEAGLSINRWGSFR
jgi:hypothetical protein